METRCADVSPAPAPTSASTSTGSHESSISVAVRVRPFTETEQSNLREPSNEQVFLGDGSLSNGFGNSNDNQMNGSNGSGSSRQLLSPRGIRRIIDVVDDKMLIFDPPETNPLAQMQKSAFPNTKISGRIREHRFVFDRLFDVLASQEDVYEETTRPLLDSVLDGFNATVFAYGATGCGKTYTILGTPVNPGVIFLTMKELYQRIEALADTKVFDVSLSFLEIYNETIRDLLRPETPFKKLVLREDANKKISVSHLLSHKPKSVDDVMELILLGNENRTSSPTEANATSSRSHAVLQINVVQKNRTADVSEEHTFATLSIIDLAGSERAAATKNRGATLNEGANINKSLLALGNCINALCDPRRKNHVPYRDLKLTRLLKFSLGGNCKTVMIVCVSPLSQHYDETLNTLKYADRAKEIKTKLKRNRHNLDRHVGSYLKMITEQKLEIEELRNRESVSIEKALLNNKKVNFECLEKLMSSINSLRSSISKQSHEKWKKYFILAKRKVLILQKIRVDTLLHYFEVHFRGVKRAQALDTMISLSEQLLSKLETQIKELENQYSKATDIDTILNDTTYHMLRKLKELESWSDKHTVLFEQNVQSLKEVLEKEVLFNSSILFDHLIHEVKEFDFLPGGFVEMLLLHYQEGKENYDSLMSYISKIVQNVNRVLQQMVNGDFDLIIESVTSEFLQNKLVSADYQVKGNNRDNPVGGRKMRDGKRVPGSPLKSSPPRDFKKTTKSKQLLSLNNRHGKKVRWDVPNFPNSVDESDMSMDANTSQENNALKSDIDDDSPLGNSVIDKSGMIDDLYLKFDPTLSSPPMFKVQDNQNFSIMSKEKNDHPVAEQSSANKRIPLNLEHHDNQTKLPLLKKEASTKVLAGPGEEKPSEEKLRDEDGNLKDMIGVSSKYFAGQLSKPKFKMHSLGAPSRLMNKYSSDDSSRNIESNGSEKVD